jgi:fucose permease
VKPSAWKAWVEPRTLLIGVIPLASSFSEGSANNWLSIAVVDSFQQLESTGAVTLGIFIGAMTLVRSLGYTLISHLGRAHTLQLSLISSILGLAIFGSAPNFTVAAIGVAAWGFGAALCFPICVAAVSQDAAMASARVSVMVSMSSVAAIIAPPALGNMATSIGARGALMLVPIALIACLLVSRKTEPDPAPIYSDVADPVTA